MHVEVSVAVNFVVTFLYGKLPRRRVHMLGEELDKGVRAKFHGHWYPEQPLKGTAYRSLKVSGDHTDPLMFEAARETGLEAVDIFQHLPDNLTLWIDPGEVSYRIGEKGTVTVLYTEKGQQDAMQAVSEFNPEAQDFIPIADQLLMAQNFAHLGLGQTSPPVLGGGGLSQQQQLQQQQSMATAADLNSYLLQKSSSAPNFFTAAAFAQTKFGSTKLRQQTRRPNRLHAGGGGGGGGGGGVCDSGRRARGAAMAALPSQQQQQQHHQQHHQPHQQALAASGYASHFAAFNRSFSLSPGVGGGVDWSTGLSGPDGGSGNLLSVHIPGVHDYHQHQHHSNGSSRQVSPGGGGVGGGGNSGGGRPSEQLLLAK